MIRQIEEGTGLGFTVLLNDKQEQFRLVIIAKKNWRDDKFTDYSFGYMNQSNTLFTTSCYSGGNTGFGINPRYGNTKIDDEWIANNKLVTDNLEEIKKMALEATQKQADDREAEIARKTELANKINELPTTFPIGLAQLDQFQFVRTEAIYRPGYSSNVYVASVHIEKRVKKNAYNNTFCLSYYMTKDRKLQVKKFTEAANYFFGVDIMKQFEPKELFLFLLGKEQEIKNKIKEIKNA